MSLSLSLSLSFSLSNNDKKPYLHLLLRGPFPRLPLHPLYALRLPPAAVRVGVEGPAARARGRPLDVGHHRGDVLGYVGELLLELVGLKMTV